MLASARGYYHDVSLVLLQWNKALPYTASVQHCTALHSRKYCPCAFLQHGMCLDLHAVQQVVDLVGRDTNLGAKDEKKTSVLQSACRLLRHILRGLQGPFRAT